MLTYAVDLGTTNLKVALYDQSLRRLALSSKAVVYNTREERVEFDPSAIVADVIALIGECASLSGIETRHRRAVIVLTGQASRWFSRAGIWHLCDRGSPGLTAGPASRAPRSRQSSRLRRDSGSRGSRSPPLRGPHRSCGGWHIMSHGRWTQPSTC